MDSMHLSASARHGVRDLLASAVAAAVATILIWTVVYADPTGGIFPALLTDRSCQDAGSDGSNRATDCDPDTPGWAQASDDSQPRQVIVAENVDSPGASAVAAQQQETPITQLP
jgi:hypothetical protein